MSTTAAAAATDPASLPRLEPVAVKQILDSGDASNSAVVLDVRDAAEVRDGAIAGRVHLESGAFSDTAQVDALLDGPLAGKSQVIVHCMHSQKRGPACAAKLADRIKEREAAGGEKGPDVVVLRGGYEQFAEQFGDEEKLIVKGLP